MTFTVTLPSPPTANNLFPTSRSGHRFPSRAYKEWKAVALNYFLKNRSGHVDPLCRYIAHYAYAFSDARRRDLANFEKAISDFLVDQGVIPDDCQIDDFRLVRLPRVKGGVALVHIRIEEAA